MGTLTISRFFVAHVFLIPAFIFALVASHIFLFRKAADAQYVPRPEWYYLPIFQWLKYWHGSAAIVGVLVIPTLLVLAILALPFLDKSVERRPWKRPAAMGAYAFVVLSLVGLGLRSQYLHRHDSGVAQQLAKQRTEEHEYARKPFEPELSSASLAAANVTLADPLAAKGKTIFEGRPQLLWA